MQFDSNRQKPTPKAKSTCPNCKSPIIAKCGRFKLWHWAHETLEHCDSWWEPISDWHLWWQSHVDESLTEVIIGKHIADVQLSSKKVIEIQHSSLPVEVVEERENFYGDMVWIFDGRDFLDRINLREKQSQYSGNTYYTFTFKKPRKYIVLAKKFPLYIDFGDFVFKVMEFKTYENFSQQWGTSYTSYVAWGFVYDKNKKLLLEIFGKDLRESN